MPIYVRKRKVRNSTNLFVSSAYDSLKETMDTTLYYIAKMEKPPSTI